MTVSEEFAEKVGQYWSERATVERRAKPLQVRAHTSARICGVPTTRAGEAVLIEMTRRYYGKRIERAVSIGAGLAAAEIDLLARGLVEHFLIFEYSEERIRRAKITAERRNVAHRMTFSTADAFAADHGNFDLVYWRNSLHHMPDTRAAVQWSHEKLNPGGIFVMDEYTGPNRLQYTERQMRLCDLALSIVPEEFFRLADGKKVSRNCVPPPLKRMIERDPSEASDSESILQAVRDTFPGAAITAVGGLIFFAGIRRIFQNFDPERDAKLIDTLLEMDGKLADRGESIHHVAFAQKAAIQSNT